MTFGLTNISTDRNLKLNDLPSFEQQGQTAFKEGDILEGIVTSVSKDEVEVSFAMTKANDPAARLSSKTPAQSFKKTFPESSIKGARAGEKRSFEVMKASGDTFVLKDLGPVATGDGKVTFTGVDMAGIAQVKSFNDTMGIGEQEDDENTLDSIRSRMSDEDAAGFCDEGLSVKDYLAEQLESALDRVKLGLEIKRRYSEETGRKIKEETRELRDTAGFSGTPREREIAKKLSEADLPVTDAMIRDILSAENLALSAHALTDGAKAELIGRGHAPSVTGYYKAGLTTASRPSSPISDKDFEELLPRIGLEIDKANTLKNSAPGLDEAGSGKASSVTGSITANDARWLIDHELPVTGETLLMKDSLDSFVPEADSILSSIVEGVKNGFKPAEAPLNLPGFEGASGVITDTAETTGAALTGPSQFEVPKGIFTFTDPAEAGRFIAADHTSEIAAVTARRRLEESRLTFMLESRSRSEALTGSSDSVIEGIEDMIRTLKAVEERYYSDCFKEVGDIPTPEKTDRLAEIIGSFDELGKAPAYILSTTLTVRTSITVTELNAEGDRLKSVFARAEQTYEAVGTQIRGDLGDSIIKAFTNIDELLAMEGYELTDTNRRAARILGYNRMELSESNMTAVKAYDLEVRGLIDSMKPVVAAELVKRGIDPLNIPLPELTNILKQLKSDKEKTTDERYSEFLVRMDREGALTPEERSAYIGIYRLLNRIEKTDGAVIGDCLRRGVELTMGNLLSADRTRRHGHVDARIDDSFGGLDQIISRNVSISEQILGAITPGKMDLARQLAMSPEEFLEDLNKNPDPDIANVDIELLKEDIADASAAGSLKAFLHMFDEPATVGNLLAMQEMVTAPDVYEKLLSLPRGRSGSASAGQVPGGEDISTGQAADVSDVSLQEAYDLPVLTPDITDTVDDLRSSYEDLLTREEEAVTAAYDSPEITSALGLRLSRIGAQVSLLGSFAKKDFYELPITTGEGTVLMNLTLRRGTDDKGLIGIRFRSGSPADMTVRVGTNSIDGLLTCGDRSLEGPLKEALAEAADRLRDGGYEEVRFFYAGTASDEEAYLERIAPGSPAQDDTSRLLDIAKVLTRALAWRM